MSDRTFEDGWRAACESLAATYTDVARDSIELERRENFSNAAAAARFRANEPDTPAPSDAARSYTPVCHECGHAKSKHFADRMRGSQCTACVCMVMAGEISNEPPPPTPPPIETAAVEELDALDELRLIEAALRNKGMHDWQRVIVVRTALPSIRAALTRLRATTTVTKENDWLASYSKLAGAVRRGYRNERTLQVEFSDQLVELAMAPDERAEWKAVRSATTTAKDAAKDGGG